MQQQWQQSVGGAESVRQQVAVALQPVATAWQPLAAAPPAAVQPAGLPPAVLAGTRLTGVALQAPAAARAQAAGRGCQHHVRAQRVCPDHCQA